MVWWLGPCLVHHVSDCAPLCVCLRPRGTLGDLWWLPLLAGERRVSIALRRAPSAPGQDHELTWLCMHACVCTGIVCGSFTAPVSDWVCGGLCGFKSSAGQPGVRATDGLGLLGYVPVRCEAQVGNKGNKRDDERVAAIRKSDAARRVASSSGCSTGFLSLRQ